MHPRLLQTGHIFLPTYGALVAAGVLCGLALAIALARRAALDPEKIWNLGILGVFAAIIGAKLLLILDNWSAFRAAPFLLLSFSTLRAGGVFSGGIALAFAACALYAVHAHLPLLRTMDVAAPAVALGHGIGRIGCFAAGCCYGHPTTLPWGVTFTSRLAARTTGVPLGIALHPTQLYESAVEFLLCALCLWLIARTHRNGEVMGAWLFLYGMARFFLEFLRGDPGRGSVFGGVFTVTQLLAIAAVMGSALLFLRTPANDRTGSEVATQAHG